jgi:hypothetical protein
MVSDASNAAPNGNAIYKGVVSAFETGAADYMIYGGGTVSCRSNVAVWVDSGILFVEDRTFAPNKLVAIYAPGKWDSVALR